MATPAAPAAPAAAPVQAAPAPAAAPAPVTQTIVRVVEAPPPVEQAPAEPKVSNWETIKAKAGLPADLPESAPAEEAPPVTDWDNKFTQQPPAQKPTNVAERLKLKAQKEAEARSAAALQQQIAERDQRLNQLTQEQQYQRAQFGELIKKGDADAAMKVLGTGMSFEEMTRQVLIAKGALQAPSADPRVDALLQQREAEQRQQQEWYQQQEQLRIRQAQQQEWEQNVVLVQEELGTLQDIPDAPGFAKLPGVAESVLRRVNGGLKQGQDVDPVRAAWETDQEYRALYNALHEHYGKRGGVQQTAAAAPPPASVAPLTRVARPTTPATKLPENLWGESRWEAIKRERGIQ